MSQANFNSPGVPLATALLNLNLILTLEKKGVLSEHETNEIIEHALLNLETHQALAQDQSSFVEARGILEWLRQALRGAAPSPRPD